MWLGEQITARGIGNGISLIIMAGIVAELPAALISTLELGKTGALSGIANNIFLIVSSISNRVYSIYGERSKKNYYPIPKETSRNESHARSI